MSRSYKKTPLKVGPFKIISYLNILYIIGGRKKWANLLI